MLRLAAAVLLLVSAASAARADQYFTNGSIACRSEQTLATLYNAMQSHNEAVINSLVGKDKPCRTAPVGAQVTILKGGLYVSEVNISDLDGIYYVANAGIRVAAQTPPAK